MDEADIDDDLDIFKGVLASIRVDNIASFASSIRSTLEVLASSVECVLLRPPFYGSHHILFPIQFQDGQEWLLKVPASGYGGRFEYTGARSLASEAQTMRMLRQETTIPIPRVFSYDTTFDNALNRPYILMEKVVGIALPDLWFNTDIDQSEFEVLRTNVLDDVTAAMVQLEKYTFPTGGQPVYNDDSEFVTIGPMKQHDTWAELARTFTDKIDPTPIFCELGPFPDAKSFFMAMLDR
jgi:hypothetical protein